MHILGRDVLEAVGKVQRYGQMKVSWTMEGWKEGGHNIESKKPKLRKGYFMKVPLSRNLELQMFGFVCQQLILHRKLACRFESSLLGNLGGKKPLKYKDF